MSKRTAKKRIGAAIAFAIDHVLVLDLTEEQLEARVNTLFNVYEDSMARINASSQVKTRSDVKKHFSSLFNDVKQAVSQAIKA